MKPKLASPQKMWNPRPGLLKTALLFSAILGLSVSVSGLPDAECKEAEILLLHTNNVTGHLFPCPT